MHYLLWPLGRRQHHSAYMISFQAMVPLVDIVFLFFITMIPTHQTNAILHRLTSSRRNKPPVQSVFPEKSQNASMLAKKRPTRRPRPYFAFQSPSLASSNCSLKIYAELLVGSRNSEALCIPLGQILLLTRIINHASTVAAILGVHWQQQLEPRLELGR